MTKLTPEQVAELTAGDSAQRASALCMSIVDLMKNEDADTVVNALIMAGVNKLSSAGTSIISASVAAEELATRVGYWHQLFVDRES